VYGAHVSWLKKNNGIVLIALAVLVGLFILYETSKQPDAYTTPDCAGGGEWCN